MNPIVYFLIFLLSGIPEADRYLEVMQSMLQATRDFSKNIKSRALYFVMVAVK